jgi:hypothetical protein
VNGDEVRDVKFSEGDYDASQVRDLLECIAAELDAGRPARPLIENATFQMVHSPGRGYETCAVDWFLNQIRHREDPSEAARANADPWRELAAEPYDIHSEPGDPAVRTAAPSPQECADAWRDFDRQPGTRLSWVRTGLGRRELRTADQQAVASFRRSWWDVRGPIPRGGNTLSAGGRTFTFKRVTPSAWPTIAETISRDLPHAPAHAGYTDDGYRLLQLLDETGEPVLYTAGTHFDHFAGSYIKFPGQRWLRFPVRGTSRGNAIMTAVDQDGNKVARYRLGYARETDYLKTVMITVHPDHRLTEELALAIAVSPTWLSRFFKVQDRAGP